MERYIKYLEKQELAAGTKKKYIRDIRQLLKYLKEKDLDLGNNTLIEYKDYMLERLKANTVNTKIISINKYLEFIDKKELQLKQVKIQQKHNLENVMTENDFKRILRQAKAKGTDRDVIMLNSLYYTGLRVSELKYLTVDALKCGYITVSNKGKIRNVPIAKVLEKDLKAYVKKNNIKQGAIIKSSNGKPLSRTMIFRRIKYLGGQARINLNKVYPHSIRHLFAKQWLKANGNNYLQLADILGHSSLETTRIYSKLSIDEMKATINF